MHNRKVWGLLGSPLAVAALAAAALSPAWTAEPPAPFQKIEVGDTGAAGSVDVDATGKWTVKGSGTDISNDGPEDSFYFVARAVQGDGTIIARLTQQPAESGTTPRTGIMIRGSDAVGAPFAGEIMTTTTLAWYSRTEADANNTRANNVDSRTFPRWLRMQRVGNVLTGFTSRDGKLWTASPLARTEVALDPSALFGLAVSSRVAGELTTGIFDNVAVLPGVVSVYGWESAANDQAAMMSWQPVPTAAGYLVYRGPKSATTIAQLALVTAAPLTDSSYLDTNKADVSFRDLQYAVSAVYRAPDASTFEGPAVRIR